MHSSGVPTIPVKDGETLEGLFMPVTVSLKPSAGGVGGVKAPPQLSAMLSVTVFVATESLDQEYSNVTVFVPT